MGKTLLFLGLLTAAAWADLHGSIAMEQGLVDADHGAVYLSNGQYGIDAVNLSDGHTRWTSTAPTNFIAVSDRRLWIWKAGPWPRDGGGIPLRLEALDTSTGHSAGQSDPYMLPSWAGGNGGGSSFDCRGSAHDGAIWVHWSGSTHYWGGAAPSQEMLAASTHNGSGDFRIDLSTLHVAPVDVTVRPTVAPLPTEVTVGGTSLKLVQQSQGQTILRTVECFERGNLRWQHPVAPDHMLMPPP